MKTELNCVFFWFQEHHNFVASASQSDNENELTVTRGQNISVGQAGPTRVSMNKIMFWILFGLLVKKSSDFLKFWLVQFILKHPLYSKFYSTVLAANRDNTQAPKYSCTHCTNIVSSHRERMAFEIYSSDNTSLFIIMTFSLSVTTSFSWQIQSLCRGSAVRVFDWALPSVDKCVTSDKVVPAMRGHPRDKKKCPYIAGGL